MSITNNLSSKKFKLSILDLKNILVIIFIWSATVILVNPLGNFPLNDDWAYGWSVKTLLETGNFQLSDWTATNLLPQVFWGALFCLPFGFSFTALRFSTLTLGLIGVITTYDLLREANSSPKYSLVGALIVALNPLYFVLSNSFMSDVPSFTFAILALYFLIRGLKRNSHFEILIGIVVAFVSILNRQSNLIILPAFGFAYLLKKGLNSRNIVKAFFPTLVGIALYLSYSKWLQLTERIPILYNFQAKQLLKSFSSGFLEIISIYSENLLIFSIYLGLFLFPLLIVKFPIQYHKLSFTKKRISLFTIFIIVAAGIVYCLAAKKQMPLVGNVINPFGLVYEEAFLLKPISITIINIIWKNITIVGLIGSALLFQYFSIAFFKLVNQKQNIEVEKKWLLVLTLFTIFMYFLPIGVLKKIYWFDRYLIFLLPLLMMLVSITTKNGSKKRIASWAVSTSLIMLLLYGGFTISATHDYLSWNRVRWQAVHDLMQEFQVSPNQINGGFEFNGWYFGNRLEKCNPKYQKSPRDSSGNWADFTCLWGGNNYKYTISLVPQIGYKVEKTYSYRKWLLWSKENLYLLRQNTNA
ncbi:hypothetical protein NIES4072_34860 [Nostoc commune NIES-4072]|uniref:Glycosyltransferase RgtA/B/C/D-like domain-containing protein n=1 Tax=Nostoc commune NIES-4072 TaxID=2005467 RepID=A0A2R5FLZ6_NOSCO|nr:glycosyltransferase family 39 protein [Nostoc commune]BBD69185.1 hypothetical protein NIES4070_55930 [Nostoc commune HK-02]GBG19817.1 hypothetical protein NIES4072_34860 [Nostoc commune NIES-4072]